MAEEDLYGSTVEVENSSDRFKLAGALNVAVIFGVAAIALTLILTPFIDRHSQQIAKANVPAPAVDDIKTGSITTNDGPKRYIVRRSLLQHTPGAVCIINSDGSSSGC